MLDEDEVQYQSAGKYHKERFQHLTMLHEHWTHQVGLLLISNNCAVGTLGSAACLVPLVGSNRHRRR